MGKDKIVTVKVIASPERWYTYLGACVFNCFYNEDKSYYEIADGTCMGKKVSKSDCTIIDTNKQQKDSLLLQAEKIVNGDRNEQYGDCGIAFKEYSEILKTTFGIELTPEQICKVLISIKLGRLKYKYKEDSVLDTMGYLEILNRLQH